MIFVAFILYMKLKNTISSLALLFVYSMLTIVGIGIYYCGCTQSRQLVLAVQTECPPCSAAAESCCSHGGDENNECRDDECCLLAYQYVNVDQLYVAQPYNEHSKVFTLSLFSFVGLITSFKESFIFAKNHSPPPELFKIPIIYLHRQLRL